MDYHIGGGGEHLPAPVVWVVINENICQSVEQKAKPHCCPGCYNGFFNGDRNSSNFDGFFLVSGRKRRQTTVRPEKVNIGGTT